MQCVVVIVYGVVVNCVLCNVTIRRLNLFNISINVLALKMFPHLIIRVNNTQLSQTQIPFLSII